MISRLRIVSLNTPKLSVRRLCSLLGMKRNCLHHHPVVERTENVKMMRQMLCADIPYIPMRK